MLPSARRAALSRQYFDNSYLSRRAFEVDANDPTAEPLTIGGGALDSTTSVPQRAGGARHYLGKESSFRSRTTAGLTTFDEDPRLAVDDYRGGSTTGAPGNRYDGYGPRSSGGSSLYRDGATVDGSLDEGVESDYSDQDSLGSLRSGESYPSTSKSYEGGIRYATSPAAQIWQTLDRMDDIVDEVKGNVCQCQRLGARLAALKKPMVAVHKGRQTADQTVLATIKDLVTEAQHFMERFLDPGWWRNEAGHKEDSEMFRELTFRLGFLMQAPPGFQEQSQEEDHIDRLKDYGDLESVLEDQLRMTKDERLANEIMDMLRRVRMRMAAEGADASPEIDLSTIHFDTRERSLGNGGFGTVSAATLAGNPVVVKRLNNQSVRSHLLEDMRRDIHAFCQLQYDFVVKTIGGCTVRPHLCIVTERAPSSLFQLLHRQDEDPYLSQAEKAAMLYDVARGVQFLHIKKIIHGNLKSSNVLVFEHNRIKVSDFGLIAIREEQSIMGGGDTVPSAAWTAPEVLDDQDPSVLSDVYSFGILVHEVLTQRIPFAGKSVAKVITAVVAKGQRPGYLENEEETLPRALVKLADFCWTQAPAARPTSLNTIVTELGHVVTMLGGDPRPLPSSYEQTAGESAGRQGSRESSTGGTRAKMTLNERRIHDLEKELLALKMQQRQGGESSRGAVKQGAGGVAGRGKSGSGEASSGYGRDEAVAGIAEERKALRALYTSTQGPGWRDQRGWETNDPDLSAWHGVVCGDSGHVTALHLPSNNLQGQLPRELENLRRLKILDLSDNLLEGRIPPEYGKLARLTDLNLSMNDLTGAIPSELATAACLEHVYLQCNGLDGIMPRALLQLNNLEVLVVDWRSLADTHPFRNFRKASPPVTEEAVARAASESRKAALKRAVDPSLRPRPSQGRPPPRRLSSDASSYDAAFDSANGSAAFGGGGSGRHAASRSNAGSSGGGGGGPLRSKLLGKIRGGGIGGGGSEGDGMSVSSGSERSFPGAARSAASTTSHGDPRSPYTAPVAPYQGADGMLGQARAKAKATQVAKPNKARSAWRAFKDIVAVDMHPGYTDHAAGKHSSTAP